MTGGGGGNCGGGGSCSELVISSSDVVLNVNEEDAVSGIDSLSNVSSDIRGIIVTVDGISISS
jgi:hypothetical protein